MRLIAFGLGAGLALDCCGMWSTWGEELCLLTLCVTKHKKYTPSKHAHDSDVQSGIEFCSHAC